MAPWNGPKEAANRHNKSDNSHVSETPEDLQQLVTPSEQAVENTLWSNRQENK